MRRTKADAEKTRQDILRAALTLFCRNGYSKTTLAMIGAEAGYSRGPIYWHFRNKDDLYHAVLGYSQNPLNQLVQDAQQSSLPPLQAIDVFVRRWLDLLVEDDWFRQSFEILLNKTELTESMIVTLNRERALTQSVVDCLATLLAKAQDQGQIPSTQSPRELSLLVYTQLMGITQSWLFAPDLFDLGNERAFFVNRLHRLLELT